MPPGGKKRKAWHEKDTHKPDQDWISYWHILAKNIWIPAWERDVSLQWPFSLPPETSYNVWRHFLLSQWRREGVTADNQWVEAGDAAKHPPMHWKVTTPRQESPDPKNQWHRERNSGWGRKGAPNISHLQAKVSGENSLHLSQPHFPSLHNDREQWYLLHRLVRRVDYLKKRLINVSS